MKKIIPLLFLIALIATGCSVDFQKPQNYDINSLPKSQVREISLGADSGAQSPGTMANDDTVGYYEWADPDNAKSSNDSYAIASRNTYAGTTGSAKAGNIFIVKSDGSYGETDKAEDEVLPTSDDDISYGADDDLWGETWSDTDINDSDFGVAFQAGIPTGQYNPTDYLVATNFGFSIPSGATIDGILVEIEIKERYEHPYTFVDVDHIQITVYYTEGGEPPSDTCTAPASGDWYINSSDNCYVTGDTYITGALNLLNTGEGSLNIIDDATLSVQSINSTSTDINVEAGCKIKFWTAQ